MELREKGLHREGSLCSPDPHQQLLKAFKDRDLGTFQNILNQGTRDSYIDPNHWYDDPHHGTLLDLTCRSQNNSQYVRALLQAGTDPNKINPVRKKSPLHFTLETKDIQSFELILNDPRTNPNTSDNKGNAPIHLAAELQNTEFLVKLLSHPNIDVRLANKKGQTALHIAAQQENEDSSLMLVKAGVDLDSTKNAAGKSGRDMLELHLPQLVLHLPEFESKLSTEEVSNIGNGSTTNDLFTMLYNRNIDSFITAIRMQDRQNLDSYHGDYTYLQYACDFGLHKVVEALLRLEANPNATSPSNKRSPLMIAGYRGYIHIIRLFVQNVTTEYKAINDENVLHSVIKGMSDNQLALGASKENRDYYQCLEHLLLQVPRTKLDINYGDVKGNTPLHYAAKLGEPKVIWQFLRHGAYVGHRNVFGQPALADINPKIFEHYLDECLRSGENLPREDNYEIFFKYNFLAPPKPLAKSRSSSQIELQVEFSNTDIANDLDESMSETDPLLYMTRSTDLRPLLKHPILTSFIYLKWHRIKRFFFFNLTFYILFWAFLTAYILGIYGAQTASPENSSETNSSKVEPDIFQKYSDQGSFSELLRVLVAVFLLLLIVREVFQLFISPVKYISSPENWLEIALILVTISILFGNTTARQQISAVAILLSWAELVLLIGRHPANSTNIEMLKTVSWNFLTFLAWYSILIVAFALSFYTLFRDTKDNEFFADPGVSIFKTIVMLTGEFDTGSIGFDHYPGVSHVVFVSFVFLIAIVLFNLLNGLAVSDTQAIRADAELVGYVSQIKLVSYLETMAFGDPTPFKDLIKKMKTICCYMPNLTFGSTQFGCLKMLSKRMNVFSDLSSPYEVCIFPNQENRVEHFENGHKRKRQELRDEEATCVERCSTLYMDPLIVKAAREILTRREEENDINQVQTKSDKILIEYGRRLDIYKVQLEDVKRSTEKTQSMLQELLDLTKRKQ